MGPKGCLRWGGGAFGSGKGRLLHTVKPPCEESVTLAIVRSPLFGEILDALRDDDAVGMLLRVDALETQFASHPVLHYFRGVAYEVLGDADEAHTCYLTAVRGAVAELAKDVNDGFTLDRLQWVACYGSERLAAGFSSLIVSSLSR